MAGFGQFRLDQGLGDRFLRIERREPADEVFEFAHVTGPAISLHSLESRAVDLLARQSFLFDNAEEVPRQVHDVLGALTQRRKTQRYDVETEEQILPEQALLYRDPQVLVRGGDDADIGAIGVRPPTVVYSPCCRTRSSRVCASIGMSPISSRNSVPPSACSKRPDARCIAPVKAPFSCPKSSLSIRSRGIAAMFTATNGPLAPLSIVVEGARHEFLPGSGLAGDHDREVGLHQSREGTVDLLHRRRTADQGNIVLLIIAGHGNVASAGTGPARRWQSAP